jgi:hypothetical protein
MLSWNKFINKSDISNLDINEQRRLYYNYKNDYYYRSSQSGSLRFIDRFLLQEDGFYLQQENGFKIKL